MGHNEEDEQGDESEAVPRARDQIRGSMHSFMKNAFEAAEQVSAQTNAEGEIAVTSPVTGAGVEKAGSPAKGGGEEEDPTKILRYALLCLVPSVARMFDTFDAFTWCLWAVSQDQQESSQSSARPAQQKTP